MIKLRLFENLFYITGFFVCDQIKRMYYVIKLLILNKLRKSDFRFRVFIENSSERVVHNCWFGELFRLSTEWVASNTWCRESENWHVPHESRVHTTSENIDSSFGQCEYHKRYYTCESLYKWLILTNPGIKIFRLSILYLLNGFKRPKWQILK